MRTGTGGQEKRNRGCGRDCFCVSDGDPVGVFIESQWTCKLTKKDHILPATVSLMSRLQTSFWFCNAARATAEMNINKYLRIKLFWSVQNVLNGFFKLTRHCFCMHSNCFPPFLRMQLPHADLSSASLLCFIFYLDALLLWYGLSNPLHLFSPHPPCFDALAFRPSVGGVGGFSVWVDLFPVSHHLLFDLAPLYSPSSAFFLSFWRRFRTSQSSQRFLHSRERKGGDLDCIVRLESG